MCPRTKRLVEYLPLDTELGCEKHEKQSIMHYDHTKKCFVCIECENFEKLTEAPDIVETDRRQLTRSCHVLTELLTKQRDSITSLLLKINDFVENRVFKASELLETC